MNATCDFEISQDNQIAFQDLIKSLKRNPFINSSITEVVKQACSQIAYNDYHDFLNNYLVRIFGLALPPLGIVGEFLIFLTM
jgi:hypothetical protein